MAKSALGRVFRQLVTIKGDDEETPTRKPAQADDERKAYGSGGHGSFEAGQKHRRPDSWSTPWSHRLLTAKQTNDGTPVVETSCPKALLSRWQPLVDWLQTDRELLIRGRVNARGGAHWVPGGP